MDDWDDDFGSGPSNPGGAADPLVHTEYARIEQRYTDAGYREGITDGKLQTLQEGFDQAFAASVPPSRRMGVLRGRANALLAIVLASSPSTTSSGPSVSIRRSRAHAQGDVTTASAQAPSALVDEIRTLVSDLDAVKRDDVLPVDYERLAHERDEHGDEHAFELASTGEREMEGLENAMDSLAGGLPGGRGGMREEALLDALEARVDALQARVLA